MQSDSYWQTDWEAYEPDISPRSDLWIALFLAVTLVACVSLSLLVPSGLGFLVGYQQLQAQNHEAAIIHFNRGLGYLAEDYPDLARAEFEIAVQYDAAFEPAQEKLREMQGALVGAGTPVPQTDRVAQTLLDEARALAAQRQWSDAITRLEQLRTLNPDYRRTEVADLLYQTYVNGGKAAEASGQIQLARERFDAALAIRNGDPQVRTQRDWAVLYLEGMQAVGYSWQTAAQKFAALYQQAPNYHDVKAQLFNAHVQYGNLAAKQNAWCLAVREYDSALALTRDAALADTRAQAMTLCKQAIVATPTPIVSAPATYLWKTIVTDLPCNGSGDIAGSVRDAVGSALTGVWVGYYADGVPLTTTRTNASGQYQFILGKEAGVLHVVILGTDGKVPVSLAAEVQYPGGASLGCHVIVDWQKAQ